MLFNQPVIHARPAHPTLAPFVIGFVERSELSADVPYLELPFAVPVIHIALGSGLASDVSFSRGCAVARMRRACMARRIFVVALGFSGAHALLRPWMREAPAGFVEVQDDYWSSLHARLSEAITFEARTAIVEQALIERLASPDGLLPSLKAADAIIRDRWRGSVASLADDFGTEERTLRNRFRSEIGSTPKQLLRLARFNRALRSLHPGTWAGMPSEDVRLEFVDQAHFHHEFVALAGISPTAFTRAKRISGDRMLHNVRLDSLSPSAIAA